MDFILVLSGGVSDVVLKRTQPEILDVTGEKDNDREQWGEVVVKPGRTTGPSVTESSRRILTKDGTCEGVTEDGEKIGRTRSEIV